MSNIEIQLKGKVFTLKIYTYHTHDTQGLSCLPMLSVYWKISSKVITVSYNVYPNYHRVRLSSCSSMEANATRTMSCDVFERQRPSFSAEVQWLWSFLSWPKGNIITDLEWMMEHKFLDWLFLIYRQASSELWGKMILAIFDYFFIVHILYSASALRLFSGLHFCKLEKYMKNNLISCCNLPTLLAKIIITTTITDNVKHVYYC